MESTIKSSSRTSGRPPLIAKSPSSDKSVSGDPRSPLSRWVLGCLSIGQSGCGLAMVILGILCAVNGLAMSRLGAGVSGGLVALLAGLAGTLAAVAPYTCSIYYTVYLALCLVSVGVNTLVLVLTLTAVVRDAQIDIRNLPPEESENIWAGQWCGIGLLSATSFHLLCTLLSLPISCRRACQSGKQLSEEVSDTKQSMVRSWLGQQSNNLILVPPHLLKEASQCSPSPVYPALGMPIGLPVGVPVPYPRTVTPMRGYHQPHRPRNNPHPHYLQQAPQAAERPKRKEKKKREITEEELEKTYTGLDREIAEEFISIAMQPSSNSNTNTNTNSSATSGSLRSSSEDTTVSSSRALRP